MQTRQTSEPERASENLARSLSSAASHVQVTIWGVTRYKTLQIVTYSTLLAYRLLMNLLITLLSLSATALFTLRSVTPVSRS